MDEAALFAAALEKASPAEQLAYVKEACGQDDKLRRRLEALLRAHAEPDDLLDATASVLLPLGSNGLSEGPGTRIGPYKLLEQIGEGGFGLIFVAEQQEPVRRKVAIKVIKPGMDSAQVIARFEAERQALALMEHPHIARVLDAGATASGRPYFVMELVRGIPITDFCEHNHLTPRQRLELFVSVCQAVQHAHHKGIIHRDLKPSNILVTLHDGVPVVKVIDFGIAKAIGQPLTDKTLFTNFAQMIGTPMYMSPEQAEMSGLDIDTRTDIYALGVLLYELLTGTTPFDKERLRSAAYDELRRIIREEEPPRPSTRISTLAKTATQGAGGDLRRLREMFRGELDWIVMKALEKDRNRRYETASALAADVERFLHDEPVQACPPSLWYRFRKLARRNKGAFVTAAALGLGVLLAVISLAISNIMIRQEQARTQEEKERAEKALLLAEAAQKLAEQRAEQIRDDFEHLTQANTLIDRSRAYAGELRWDDAHAALSQAVELRKDHASAWAELADLNTRLGLWEMAAPAFAEEYKLRKPDGSSRWYLHALLRLWLGDTAGYRQLAAGMREKFRGTSNAIFLIEVVRTSVLQPDPEVDREQLVELAQHAVACRGPGDWWSLYALGLAHYRAGQHALAEQRLVQSLAADDREWSVRTLSYSGLAMARQRLGKTAQAREALKAAERVLDHWTEEMYQDRGASHWISHLGATGHWAVPWWDWLEGRWLYREAKLLIDGSPPPDDPRIHVLRARAFAGIRWHGRAQAEYDAALKRLPQDPRIQLEAHRNRGYGYIQFRHWKQVAAEFEQAWELKRDEVYLGMFSAVAHLAAREVDAYRRTCAGLVQQFEKTKDAETARCVILACVLRPDTLADKTRLLPLARVATPPNNFGPVEVGAALFRAGKYEQAIRIFESANKVYYPRPAAWCFLAMAHHQLGHDAAARHALDEVRRWIEAASHQKHDDPTATRPAWANWHEPLECAALLEEATSCVAAGVSR